MLDLRRGDRLPIVAACQALLNAYSHGAANITVDGEFGPRTEEAVRTFRASHGLPAVDGSIDREVWEALSAPESLRVHDSLDVFDPTLYETLPFYADVGARPVMMGGMCDGVGAMRGRIAASGIRQGKLLLLRFMGHGNQGVAAVAYGTRVHIVFDAIRRTEVPDLHHPPPRDSLSPFEVQAMMLESDYSGLSNRSLGNPDIRQRVRALRPFFSPFGSVEFHGCQIGGGRDGTAFLRTMADLLGVPAVGARSRQRTGNAVRYSGPVEIQCPGGASLAAWASSLPAYSGAA